MKNLKESLTNGSIVELRNGDKFIFLINANYFNHKKLLISLKKGNFIDLDSYNNDLIHINGDSKFDIMKICNMYYAGDNIRRHIINNIDYWTWEREEEPVKLTLKDIAKKFDVDVNRIEIVEGLSNEIYN